MSYSNRDFLIAKHFEMKEEVSFKMGYDLLFKCKFQKKTKQNKNKQNKKKQTNKQLNMYSLLL